LLVLALLPLILAACAGTRPEAAGKGAEWRYSGDEGPAYWAALDPAYAACAAGRRQSPVSLEGAQHAPAPPLATAYRPAPFAVTDHDHTIEADSHGAGSIVLGSTRYELVQFHFHAPSEHVLAGRHFPMELHLVHRSTDGRLAVIGILIREGNENSALAPLFEDLPGKEREAEVELSPTEILPASRTSYRYRGSLTTPPCSEDVRWIVLKEPIELSRDQILAFTHRYFGVNRPVQPLNGRMIAATS
jgi:carbonic anhydrase